MNSECFQLRISNRKRTTEYENIERGWRLKKESNGGPPSALNDRTDFSGLPSIAFT